MGIDFIATNTNVGAKLSKEIENLNPDRFLVRYEFMEVLSRIAQRKYKKEELKSSEKIEKLLMSHIIPNSQNFDPNLWRTKYLWNEECDLTLKKYFPVIKYLFGKYSGMYSKPGKPKHTSLEEFLNMINMTGVIDENFCERDVKISFCLSMITIVDECENDKHTRMFRNEFIEAISRVADKAAINSPYDSDDEFRSKDISFPLNIKIKNFLEQSMKKIMKREELENMEKLLSLHSKKTIIKNSEN